MRTSIFGIALSALLCTSLSVHAQTARLGWTGVVGALEARQASASGGTVIYAMPRADERIKDPLAIKFHMEYYVGGTSSGIYSKDDASTIGEEYKTAVRNANYYGLVAVVWKPEPTSTSTLTFFYTPWSNLRKADELPPPRK